MPRLPYAARTLSRQVMEDYPDAEIDREDLDGLGVHRTLRFDKETSAKLAPVIALAGDSRIESTKVTDAGYLHVTFSPRTNADDPRRFPLAAARLVLDDQADQQDDQDS